MARKIMVGMSGGVDSSVAAYLLLRQGYEVTGVTFKLWDDPALESGCCSADDVRDAAYVCQQLGIPHYVLNYKDLFRQEVVGPFAEEYLRGRTPNPCISCNRYIKFGAFSHKLRELGFDLMATGHYACCGYNEATGRWELKRAIHPEKDQSYVLYNLTQEQLAMLRLPLGEYSKPEIRTIAEESGLVVAKKPDSQDICFVPDGDYNAFLRRWTGQELPAGQFVAEDGTVYQHIIDPRTGRPADSDLLSVTVISDDGTAADAYSTALYVMGEQEAVSFWRAHGGFDLILITADGRLLYTPELADTITAPEGCAYDFQPIIAQPAA